MARIYLYGSEARPANGFQGVRVVTHPAFPFGAVELHQPLDRDRAIGIGLRFIPEAEDWPALAADASKVGLLGSTEGIAWLSPRELEEWLFDALRVLYIHASTAELLAALRAHHERGGAC